MNVPLGRAIAAGALGGMAGALFLAVFHAIWPAQRIEFDRDVPRLLVRGIHAPERDPATGLTFAWTQADMALRLPGLDRSVDWVLEMRLRAARPNADDNPDLAFHADGVLLATRRTTTDWEDVRVTIPARPDRRRGAIVTVVASRTFVPGPADQRALGVQVDALSLTPAGTVLPPRRAFAGAALPAALLGAGAALIGVIPTSAVGAAVLVGAGAASQIGRGFAPHTEYPLSIATAALWIAAALVGSAWITERRRRAPLRNTARFAAVFSACAALFKLLILLHPDMPVGDAMFHAHRFQGVLAGTIYFTSVAPGNYLFPYAPGLYLFSAPFAGLVERGAADMALLRIIVTAVDAATGLAVYYVAARYWQDRMAGAVAIALYHLIPLQFDVITTGNLTNAFAQSLSVVALALLVSRSNTFARPARIAALAIALAAAFVSHTSTFPLLLAAAVFGAGLYVLRGDAAIRRSGWAILGAAGLAFLLAVVLYYAHFLDTYRTEFARLSGETASAAPDAGGRSIGDRLGTVPYYLATYFGWPTLLLAAYGTWRLWSGAARDRLTLVLAGWALSCLVFMAIGILTPVDMRYYLAAIPALALAGGFGAARLWAAPGNHRGVGVILMAWATRLGTVGWWRSL